MWCNGTEQSSLTSTAALGATHKHGWRTGHLISPIMKRGTPTHGAHDVIASPLTMMTHGRDWSLARPHIAPPPPLLSPSLLSSRDADALAAAVLLVVSFSGCATAITAADLKA